MTYRGQTTEIPVAHHPPARDWGLYPAVVERDTCSEVVAVGDIHGGYKRLVRLLTGAGLIEPTADSSVGYRWCGGDRILVCTGDMIDKGSQSIQVLALMMDLQTQAPASGGEVIVTVGNHEAEFLADPENRKAVALRRELTRNGIDRYEMKGTDRDYGNWLRNLPFAARINDWFFSHSGNTSGKTRAELSDTIRTAIDQGDWGSPVLIGDQSLLSSRRWWSDGLPGVVNEYLRALGVNHIVFGHTPDAFANRGEIGHEEDGKIFLIDVGMSPAKNYSSGAVLVIGAEGNEVTAISLSADGAAKEVWRGPAPNVCSWGERG
jgi:hypothetical protein